jgi:hypothetical protein
MAQLQSLPSYLVDTPLDTSFQDDLLDVHLVYDCSAEDAQGKPEKWRYETWFCSYDRVAYSIHGGPMHGRQKVQRAVYQCIRPGELWQVDWLEETGTIVSLVYDIQRATVTTLYALSEGHRERPEGAHEDERDRRDSERRRGSAVAGKQTERMVLVERAEIVEKFKGRGQLAEIGPEAETM